MVSKSAKTERVEAQNAETLAVSETAQMVLASEPQARRLEGRKAEILALQGLSKRPDPDGLGRRELRSHSFQSLFSAFAPAFRSSCIFRC